MARRRGQFPEPKRMENGTWKFWYRQDTLTPEGEVVRKQRTKTLPAGLTYRQAKKKAHEFVEDINDCKLHTLHSSRTMGDLIQAWEETVAPNLKRSTVDSYHWAFKRILREFRARGVSDIQPLDVQRFLTQASQSLAPQSVLDLYQRLRGLFRTARQWGWVSESPAVGMALPEVRPHRPQIIELSEFLALAGALKQPHRSVVLLAGLAGLRRGEIEALRWNDFGPGWVVVDEAVYRGVLGSPKTKTSHRRVDLIPLVEESVAEWRRIARFTAPEDFAWGTYKNTPISLNSVLGRVLKPAAVGLGIPSVGWHDLRHCYTTWCRDAGIEPEELSKQLGHSDAGLLTRVYSHLGALKNRASVGARLADFVTSGNNNAPEAAA